MGTAASALPGTFYIEQIYSNADGTVQFVEIYDSGSSDCDAGENLWANRTLVSSGPSKDRTFVFPTNLPTCITSKRHMLIATEGFAALGLITPDYVIPNGFLQMPSGDLYFAAVSQMTYTALPSDGVTAYYRGATVGPNLATNLAGATVSVTAPSGPGGPATVNVVEYHHAAFDHYFITPVTAEQALLDAHAPPFQDWSRTGFSFNAYVNAGAAADSIAICRFFNEHFTPKSSHFYAAHGFGCEATISQFPDWGLEDDKLFNTMLPDGATGACPAGTIPLYRMYNQGMGGAPNHRFVTSLAERQKMLDHGFVAEGAGIGVGMCVPP